MLISGNLRGSEIAAAFEAALPGIHKALVEYEGPFIGRVSKNGLVKVSLQEQTDGLE